MQKIKHFQILPVSTFHFGLVMWFFIHLLRSYLLNSGILLSESPSLCVWFLLSMWMCVSSTVDRWWRRGFVQSGWWQNAVHWPDPIGGVLPAKPWGVALQTQTSLCTDHPVNKGTPEGQHDLDSEAFLDKHSQCFCALKKKDMQTNREAMLSETTVVHVVAHGPLFYFSLWEKSDSNNRLYSNGVHVLRMTCSYVW